MQQKCHHPNLKCMGQLTALRHKEPKFQVGHGPVYSLGTAMYVVMLDVITP